MDGNEDCEIWSEEESNVIKSSTVPITKRLALCNYDWMNINAKDLMLLFSSIKPSAGFIKTIKIYMSNYGKQKLEEEEKYGPQGIWNEEGEGQAKKKEKKNEWKQLLNAKEQEDDLNEKKLRQYEKDRLKYFYAIVECDAKKTAEEIYK